MSQLDTKEESGFYHGYTLCHGCRRKLKNGETGGCKQGVMVCWARQSTIYCVKHGWLSEKEYHKKHSLCGIDDEEHENKEDLDSSTLSLYDETIAPFLDNEEEINGNGAISRKLDYRKREEEEEEGEEEEEVEGGGEFLEIEQFFNLSSQKKKKKKKTPEKEKDGLEKATDELENLIPKIKNSIENVKKVSTSRVRTPRSPVSPTFSSIKKSVFESHIPSPIKPTRGNLFRPTPPKYNSEKRNRGDSPQSDEKMRTSQQQAPSPSRKNEILFEERINSFKKRYLSDKSISFWNQKELGILRQTLIVQKKKKGQQQQQQQLQQLRHQRSIQIDKLQIFHPDTGAFISLENELMPTQPHIKSPLFSQCLYYSKRWYSKIKKFQREFKEQYMERMEYTKNFSFVDNKPPTLSKMKRLMDVGDREGFLFLLPTKFEEVKFDLLNEIGVIYVVLVYTLGKEFVFVGKGDLGVKHQWAQKGGSGSSNGFRSNDKSHINRMLFKPERLFELVLLHCGLDDVYVFVVGDYRMKKICSLRYWIHKFRKLSAKYNETVVVNEKIGSEQEYVYLFNLEKKE